MTLKDLLSLASDMRVRQTNYLRVKSPAYLQEAKLAEKEFDKALSAFRKGIACINCKHIGFKDGRWACCSSIQCKCMCNFEPKDL